MKTIYYSLTVLFFLTVGTISGQAQTRVIGFDYDNSGNRTDRYLIQLKSAQIASSDSTGQEIFKGQLNNREIKIYPNPTHGNLRVEIPMDEQNDQVTLQLFNMNGSLIANRIITDETTNVELSQQPNGMYLMRISSGQSVSEWKILKE